MIESFAEVILPLPLYDRFTYRIPDELVSVVKPGIRVIVQFGARKFYSGLVYSVSDKAPDGVDIKLVEAVIDDNEVIFPVNFELWQWISDYYMAPMGDVMKAALPSALKLESTSTLYPGPVSESMPLTPEEVEILQRVREKPIPIKELQMKSGGLFPLRSLRKMIEEQLISVEEEIDEKYHEKTRTVYRLHALYDKEEPWNLMMASLKRAPKQAGLLSHFKTLLQFGAFDGQKGIAREKLLENGRFSDNTIRELVKKGILIQDEEILSRLTTDMPEQADINLLNKDQMEAISQIRAQLSDKRVVLLHGVTASGKTEIYIHLIEEACRQNKQVLYLVPEIALTPQIVHRLRKIFGNRVLVYHSKMSDAERVEVWNRVLEHSSGRNPEAQVILGARSAVFLPMTNPGLIIVDEEHENSYKQQDPSPRYNARDMAVVMGARHGIPVLLGSATPSFESYLNASSGKYGLVKLTKRHGSSKLPAIVIADVQDAYKRRKMKSMLTPQLYEAMVTALENREQIVLFQNRRGYSPYTECMDCGWIPMCKNCDVSLTYHKKSGWLTCHYCGYHLRMPTNCDRCHSSNIKSRGMGTEKVEDEIAALFPEARIARMDLDTTRSKHAFERMIRQLEGHKIDIVIGTQMVTKGLDIQHISLVGILNADNLLNFPDFRAHERAFQLMQQVSGRSGRREKEGKVVIQTSQKGHSVIGALVKQDYEKFFRDSMAERKIFFYPPWFRLIRIIVKHRNQSNVDNAAQFLADLLRKNVQVRVLGPEYPLIGRIQLWYTKEIWMKFSRDRKGPELKENIREAMAQVKSLPGNSGLVIQVDVDPM